MGKTYKDQRKYDKKARHREDEPVGKAVPRRGRRHLDEIIPEDDQLDPYEELDYLDDYTR